MAEIKSIEALKNLRLFMKLEDKDNDVKFPYETYEAVDIAIKALEKQIPKKPIRIGKDTCPKCGTYNETWVKRRNTLPNDIVYCWHCGQPVEITRERAIWED